MFVYGQTDAMSLCLLQFKALSH